VLQLFDREMCSKPLNARQFLLYQILDGFQGDQRLRVHAVLDSTFMHVCANDARASSRTNFVQDESCIEEHQLKLEMMVLLQLVGTCSPDMYN
jgi:hypothetical protein